MGLDLHQDHKVALKRHGRKLWSYRDNKPDVVEAAVLDYLRDHSFDGYFTERDRYLALFMTLAGWPGKILKRMPPGFMTPQFVYYMGIDGWISSHKFSYAQGIASVEATTIETLSEKVHAFCTRLPYSAYNSMYYFSSLKQQPEHMLGFLKAFGVERLQNEIKECFSEEGLNARRFLYNFDTDMLRRKYQWTSEGLVEGAQRLSIFNCALTRGRGFESDIDHAEEFAHHLNDAVIKSEILEACAFARSWRERTLAIYETTDLDLQIWDAAGTAIVEVKAPNDRLGKAQKNAIELARTRGERACVIYVSEAN